MSKASADAAIILGTHLEEGSEAWTAGLVLARHIDFLERELRAFDRHLRDEHGWTPDHVMRQHIARIIT